MKILHIINSMANGGAESVLKRLVINDKNNQHIIIQLISENFYEQTLNQNNIKFYYISDKFNLFFFIKVFKLPFLIIKLKPDIIQTWMYHSNIIGGIFSKLMLKKNIYWNIRHSNFSRKINFKYKIILFISTYLSYIIPKKIVYCSHISEKFHSNYGFQSNKSSLIYNGFEDIKKKINKKFKQIIFDKYQLHNKIIFGCVGRWHEQKDHNNLLRAIKYIKEINKDINFKMILIGREISNKNLNLMSAIKKYNLENEIIIMEETIEIQNIYSLFDISILPSSYGEGFSNFLSESMICNVPCIATNVGDSKVILNDYGKITPHSNSKKMYSKIIEMLNIKNNQKKWEKLKINSRNHILYKFSIKNMVKDYNNLWNEK